MKRLLALLLTLTLFSLAGCAKTEPDAPLPNEPDTENTLHLDALRVEFVVGARGQEALLRLKQELPALLTAALAEEGCTVDAVSVTFGTSAEATAQALEDGGVDAAFLPSESYLTAASALRLAALENAPVSAQEFLSARGADAADFPEIGAEDVFYENAVVLREGASDALLVAFSRALVMLCADAQGYALLQNYGCAAYLIAPEPDALLVPQRVYLSAIGTEQ